MTQQTRVTFPNIDLRNNLNINNVNNTGYNIHPAVYNIGNINNFNNLIHSSISPIPSGTPSPSPIPSNNTTTEYKQQLHPQHHHQQQQQHQQHQQQQQTNNSINKPIPAPVQRKITLNDVSSIYPIDRSFVYSIIAREGGGCSIEELETKLRTETAIANNKFASAISSLSPDEQFIFSQQRWSRAIHDTEYDLELIRNAYNSNTQTSRAKYCRLQSLRLPLASYIQSPNTGKYYLNLGINVKTLQGFVYHACEYNSSFISSVINNTRSPGDYACLLLEQNTLAIKYYDKPCCDLGISLSGHRIKEKALKEMKISAYINNILIRNNYSPILAWLPSPSLNIIKLEDYWYDNARSAYFMVTEYANCGELRLINTYHRIVYSIKYALISQIDGIKDVAHRSEKINLYRNSLKLSEDNLNAYIEFIRYLFQQMVQSIYILHKQNIIHLDISCENFVLHFDRSTGSILVKLIDFGRAKKVDDVSTFKTRTFPGKYRYMSPEAAMFCRYKDAQPYNGSREDIYGLGVVLYCMLTCTLPYDTPFYLDSSGKLNGDSNYNMTPDDYNLIDEKLDLLKKYGIKALLINECLIDYVTPQSLSLLDDIFNKRIDIDQLVQHPFVVTPPNPKLLMQIIKHLIDFKKQQYIYDKQIIYNKINNCNFLLKNQIKIQTQTTFINYHSQIQKQTIPNIIQPPNIMPIIQPPIMVQQKDHHINDHIIDINDHKTSSIICTGIPGLEINTLPLPPALASPSPPPQISYSCSPSPSPPASPNQTGHNHNSCVTQSQSQSDYFNFNNKNMKNQNNINIINQNDDNSDQNQQQKAIKRTEHKPAVHRYLLNHFSSLNDD